MLIERNSNKAIYPDDVETDYFWELSQSLKEVGEEKLAELIKTMKAEIAEEKARRKAESESNQTQKLSHYTKRNFIF